MGSWRGKGCVPGVKWPPGVAGAPRKGKVALLTGPRAGIPTCRADHPCGSQRWLRVQGRDQGRWWVVRMLGWETLCNCVLKGEKEGKEGASERPDVP